MRKLLNRNPKPKFISLPENLALTLEWTKTLPVANFDVVVGVPRAGLLIANLLASKFGKPLSTPELFVEKKVWFPTPLLFKNMRRILIVEDSVDRGIALKLAQSQIQKMFPQVQVETASLFATKNAQDFLTYFYKKQVGAGFFEWNMLTSLASAAPLLVDCDGVLAENCRFDAITQSSQYIAWLDSAKPYMIPTYSFEGIMTGRLEKHRGQTEAWLQKHNVRYKKLLMLDLPDEAERNLEKVVAHKVRCIKSLSPFWVWESSIVEAKLIRKQVNALVLCVDTMELLN